MNRLSLLFCLAFASVAISQDVFVFGKNPAFRGTSPASPIPDLLWWQCNEGAGTSLAGEGSNGGNGGTTDADWTTGIAAGGALTFNGTSDDAATTNSVSYSTNKITLSFWMGAVTTTDVKFIIESSPNWFGACSFAVYVGSGRLHVGFSRGDGNFQIEEFLPSSSTTNHYLCLFDNSQASADVRVWENGVEKSTNVENTGGSTPANFATAVCYVGARNSSEWFLDTSLDDIRVYSGDRTSDVASIYADPK